MAPISPPDRASARPSSARSDFRSSMVGLDASSIMSVELIAGFLTWGAIGWFVDAWLGTAPFGLVIGALVGNAAGLYLVYLRSSRMEGYATLQRPRPADGTASGEGVDGG